MTIFKRQQTLGGDQPKPSQKAIDLFKEYVEAPTFPEAKSAFENLLLEMNLKPGKFRDFFPRVAALQPHVPFKYKEIFKVLNQRSKQKVYGAGTVSEKQSVLIVGAGPCGLRAAVEAQLLGATVTVIEKRDDFTRNNVLKLWKFLVHDLKSLAIKKFVGQFCSGQINHIGIKTLQLFLAKLIMLMGIPIYTKVSFSDMKEPTEGSGWKAAYTNDVPEELEKMEYDCLIIASGKKVPIEGFDRRSLDAKLSIAVTANFVNSGSREEAEVEQISGISRQYHQDFFKELHAAKEIDLENVVYYRGATHYFVMTALRKSLIAKGVIKEDKEDRKELLSPSNVDKEMLHKFAIEAAQFSTGFYSKKLPVTDFALDARGNPDCAVFDFTNLYSARNASRIKVHRGYPLLMAIVGDSLLEPFWPEGTGCGRGFLSSMDAAWMLRQWSLGRVNPMEILAERENVYRLLSQTSDGRGDLKDDFKGYNINPTTRYRTIPTKIDHERIMTLYETDAVDELDYVKDKFVNKQFFEPTVHKTMLQRLRKGMVKKKQSTFKMVATLAGRFRRGPARQQQQETAEATRL